MERQNPMRLKVISVVVFAFFISCHGENKEDAHHLQQAADIHKAMMEIEEQFENQLDSLKSFSHHAAGIRDSLQVIEKDFELWKKMWLKYREMTRERPMITAMDTMAKKKIYR